MRADQDRRRKPDRGEKVEGLPVLRPKVAGIDIGSQQHWVCAPALSGEGREVQVFAATTPELEKLAAWLKQRGVVSAALESTGVYWIPLHEILESHGLEVVLVNTRELARVPGRSKTDRLDCEWIQRLHSCGLLRGAFRPNEQICILRTLVRDKGNLVAERGDWVRRMQKSLDQMNVRVHRAVADLDGATGMAIIRAIVKGERDAKQLAKLRDPRCRKSEEEIAEQLSGHWREDHLFSLAQALKMHDAINERIQDYEQELLRKLAEMERGDCQGQPAPELKNKEKAKAIRKRGEEPLRQALYRATGVDLTAIDALGVETINVVVSEYGTDLSRFPTEKQFVSHLTLAPHKPISGGKPVKKKKKPGSGSSRVAAALRMAALSLRHSQTALGAYYRQIARRIGGDVAVFATARKLATWIYRVLRWGQPYVDEGAAAYESRYQQARVQRLASTAKQLGYQLVPAAAQV
jgi:transposase